MDYIIRRCVVLSLIFILSSCTQNITALRYNHNYQEQFKKTKMMLVAPTMANVYTVDVVGSHKKEQQFENFLEELISVTIVDELKKKGYDATYLSHKKIVDNKLQKTVSIMQDEFLEYVNEYKIKPYMDKKDAFNWSRKFDSVAKTYSGDKNELQFFVITNFDEYIKTTGARVMSFLVDAISQSNRRSPVEVAHIYIAFINPKDGNIIWMNCAADAVNLFDGNGSSSAQKVTQEKIERTVEWLLSPLPEKKNLQEENIEEQKHLPQDAKK